MARKAQARAQRRLRRIARALGSIERGEEPHKGILRIRSCPAGAALVPPDRADILRAGAFHTLAVEDLPPVSESRPSLQEGKQYGFLPVVNPEPTALTPEIIAHYNERGYTPPIQIYSEAEASANRAYFDGLMAQLEAEGRDSYSVQSFHLKCRTIWDMASNPDIVARVADILGPNFVMWGSHMFCKMPNDGRAMRPVPLHQDATCKA